MFVLLMSAWASLPVERVIEVDITELNSVYHPATGHVMFRQWIWWSWSSWHEAYKVRDWRISDRAEWPRPTGTGLLEQVVRDPDGHEFRVRARVLRISHTWYDVEVADRQALPEAMRRKMRRK